jgi:DUF3068 family protein
MRRAGGVLLIALGAFAIALAVLLPTVAYHRLAVAPLDPDTETVAQGTGMTVFYPRSLVDRSVEAQRTDATVTARRIVRGKLDAPEAKLNGDVALWRVGLVIQDERRELINAVEQWVCVDRRTAEGVAPCQPQKIDDGTRVDTAADETGLNYKFPFDTQRRDYRFFDVTLRTATPIAYDGEETINGLPVYRFVQRIPATKLEDREVPAQLVGGPPGTTVTAGRYYENVRTVWVEPFTGAIVKGQETVRQVLRGPDGRDGTVLLAGTITFTPQTVQRQVDNANDGRAKLRMLRQTGPIVGYVVGALLLAGGLIVILLVRPKGTAHRRGEPRPRRSPLTRPAGSPSASEPGASAPTQDQHKVP